MASGVFRSQLVAHSGTRTFVRFCLDDPSHETDIFNICLQVLQLCSFFWIFNLCAFPISFFSRIFVQMSLGWRIIEDDVPDKCSEKAAGLLFMATST